MSWDLGREGGGSFSKATACSVCRLTAPPDTYSIRFMGRMPQDIPLGVAHNNGYEGILPENLVLDEENSKLSIMD